jgi:hypothetical protein
MKNKKYILCISGSRSLDDYSLIEKAIIYANIDLTEIKEIIAGGAKGVDRNAQKFAEYHKIKFKEYPADWKNLKAPGAIIKQNSFGSYNTRAGFDRNQKLAEKADQLLAIWDGKSNGTQHEIECFRKLGKKYIVYQNDGPDITKSDDRTIIDQKKGVEGVDYFVF